MIYACDKQSESIISLLLNQKNSININESDKYGSTALIYASIRNYTDIMNLLLSFNNTLNVNQQSNNGFSAAHCEGFISNPGKYKRVCFISQKNEQKHMCNFKEQI